MPDVIGIISNVILVIWPAPHPRYVAAGRFSNIKNLLLIKTKQQGKNISLNNQPFNILAVEP